MWVEQLAEMKVAVKVVEMVLEKGMQMDYYSEMQKDVKMEHL